MSVSPRAPRRRWREVGAGAAATFLIVLAYLAGRADAGGDPAIARPSAQQPRTAPTDPSSGAPQEVDPSGVDPSGVDPSGVDPRPRRPRLRAAGDGGLVSRLDQRFEGMGTTLRILLEDDVPGDEPSAALVAAAACARHAIDRVAETLTRFDPASELCRLNADPRPAVQAGPELRRLVAAGRWAAERTGGLVDFTLVDALEAHGYRDALPPAGDLAAALRAAPRRRPASPDPGTRWRTVDVRGTDVHRPPGVRIDSGALGKGLAADLAVAAAGPGLRAMISCGGDIAVGGGAHEVMVRHPLSGELCHAFTVTGAVATSSIHKRLWQRPGGGWAHHVIDPGTGEPAWTGLLAATALGGDGVEAEALATAALLSGPLAARRVLRPRGGLLVHEDGDVEVIAPRARIKERALRRSAGRRPPGSAA